MDLKCELKIRPISNVSTKVLPFVTLFNLLFLNKTLNCGLEKDNIARIPNSWDKMSQESAGEWIAHLPDLCSYQEYIDAHVEPAQQFPDVHFVFDWKVRVLSMTSERWRALMAPQIRV